MFGISGEHIVVLAIVLLIFGPRKLPELGNTMGKAIKNFKDAMAGVENAQFKRLPDEAPVVTPLAKSEQTEQNQASNSPV